MLLHIRRVLSKSFVTQVFIAKTVTANAVWLFLARLGTQSALFVVAIVVGRELGAAALGQYALITAIVAIGNLVSSFGMDTHLMRLASRERRSECPEYAAGLRLQLIISGLLIVMIWSSAHWITDFAWGLRWFSLALVPLGFATIYSALLRGFERMDVLMRFQLVITMLQLTLVGLVLSQDGSLVSVLFALLVGQLLGTLYASYVTHRAIPNLQLWQPLQPSDWRNTSRQGLILFGLMLMSMLLQKVGLFSLNWLAQAADVGFFNAAMRVTSAVELLPVAIFGALFPTLTGNPRSVMPRLTQITALLTITLLIVATLFWWIAPYIMFILFGAGWETSAQLLPILLLALAIGILSRRYSIVLVAQGYDRQALLATLVIVLLALPIYIGLTQAHAAIGTAWATVATASISVCVLGYTWHRCSQTH